MHDIYEQLKNAWHNLADHISTFLPSMLQVNHFFLWLGKPMMTVSSISISLSNIIYSIFILFMGFWFSRKIRRVFEETIAPKFDIPIGTAVSLGTISSYFSIVLTLALAFIMLGFDLRNIAIMASALSVGIGLGLQTIANNFISGLLLLFDENIKVGDYIELSDGTHGTITKIRVRSTIILTNDGVEIITPNSQFLQAQVVNWTLGDATKRLHVPFSVAYGSSVKKLREVILYVAEQGPHAILDQDDRKPDLWFVKMDDSSLNFELVVWVKEAATRNPEYVLNLYTSLVHRTLCEHGFHIPFPQQDMYIKSVPEGFSSMPATTLES